MADLIFPTNQGGTDSVVDSGPFWPCINLNEIRLIGGISKTITDDRLLHIVSTEVLSVNRQLANFKCQAEKQGYQTLAETVTDTINNRSVNEYHYLSAVCSYVKAKLLEAYSDYDATEKTATRAEAKLRQANDYKRDGYAAICHILGRPVVDSELI